LEGQHDLSVVPQAPHPANIPQRYHQKGCLLRSLFGDGTKVWPTEMLHPDTGPLYSDSPEARTNEFGNP